MSQSNEERISDLELAVDVLCQAIMTLPVSANPKILEALEVVSQIRRRQLDRGRLEAIAESLGDSILYVGS